MLKKLVYSTSLLLMLVVAGGVQARTVTVGAAADTWTVKDDPNAHGALEYVVLHGGSIDRTGYVRFDLSSLGKVTIEGATVTLTVHGSIPKPPYRNDNAVAGRFALYGLNNIIGNTPQDWDEATFASGNVGVEMDWTTGEVDTAGLVTDLDDNVAGITETLTPVSSPALGTTIAVSGDPLLSFIQNRVGDNGLVTFILKNDDGSDRGYGLCSKEYADEAYRPRLELKVKDVIVYVDATEGEAGNTRLATGEVFTSTADASGSDNLWRGRAFANGVTVFESGGLFGDTANPEDCSRLVTSIEVPEGHYKVYVYFWSDGSPWRIRASLINMPGKLPLFIANDPNSRTSLANVNAFEEPVPMLSEGNRTLWQACIGGTSLTTTIQVYVDDDPNHLTQNGRTWYDGIGYMAVDKSASIIWVSDNKGFGTVDPNTAADQGFIDLLTSQGYNVIYKNQFEYIDGKQYWRTLDPNKVAELEAADLIIMGRNADSGSYSTAADNEPNQWNAVTTPILSLSAHMSRVGKWGWLNSTGTVLAKEGLVTVVDPNHAVFAGVTIDPNNHVQVMSNRWNADWASVIKDAGNGKVLATRASDGLISIATWEVGQVYFEGSLFTAGGPRMLFVAGTGSKNNVAPDIAPDGFYNLTADGEKMFVNALSYMIEKGK